MRRTLETLEIYRRSDGERCRGEISIYVGKANKPNLISDVIDG